MNEINIKQEVADLIKARKALNDAEEAVFRKLAVAVGYEAKDWTVLWETWDSGAVNYDDAKSLEKELLKEAELEALAWEKEDIEKRIEALNKK